MFFCLDDDCLSLIAINSKFIWQHEKLKLVCRAWKCALDQVSDQTLAENYYFTRTQFQWWRVGLSKRWASSPTLNCTRLPPDEFIKEMGQDWIWSMHADIPWHPGELRFYATRQSCDLLELWNEGFPPAQWCETFRPIFSSSVMSHQEWCLIFRGSETGIFEEKWFCLSLKRLPHVRLRIQFVIYQNQVDKTKLSVELDHFNQDGQVCATQHLRPNGFARPTSPWTVCLVQLDQPSFHPLKSLRDSSDTSITRHVWDQDETITTQIHGNPWIPSPDFMKSRIPRELMHSIPRIHALHATKFILLNPSLSWTQEHCVLLLIDPLLKRDDPFQIFSLTPQSTRTIPCPDFVLEFLSVPPIKEFDSIHVEMHPTDFFLIYVHFCLRTTATPGCEIALISDLKFLIDLSPTT